MTTNNDPATDSTYHSNLGDINTRPDIRGALDPPIPKPGENEDPEIRQQLEEARLQQRMLRERAIKRYQVACMAYIGAIAKNTEATTMIWDRVVEKWLEGKLSGYDQSRSFRVYLKSVLRNEVFAYTREQNREANLGVVRLDSNYEHPDAQEATASEAFDRGMQQTVIDRALEAVRQADTLYHEALKVLMNANASEEKSPNSTELAAILSDIDGKKISPDNARQIKKRARQMFSRMIIKQVGLIIESDSLAAIEVALQDWNLIPYCQKAFNEMRGS